MILQLPRDTMGRPATNKARRRPLAWIIGLLLTCCLVVLIKIPISLSAAQPVVTELLGRLNLSGYPSNMRPPAFAAPTAEGQTVSLAGLQGKVVLLNFWTTWCKECRPEMPMFEQLHREFAPQGLVVLGMNVREESVAIQRYAKELGVTFPLVLDPKGEVYASYGVVGIPTTFLIGRDGRPVALGVGPRDWASLPARAIVRALLAEQINR